MIDYDTWIHVYLREHGDPNADISVGDKKLAGKCQEAAMGLQNAFPELKLVRGEAFLSQGIANHWWCVTPDGVIVNPTKRQFPWGACDYDEQWVFTRTGWNQWSCTTMEHDWSTVTEQTRGTASTAFVVDISGPAYRYIDSKYQRWIMGYLASVKGFVRGKCAEATQLMVSQNPELERRPGFVYCSWGQDQHWWCVTKDGIIVDPTANQFHGVFHYESLDLDNPEDVARIPIGSCANCSDPIYSDSECTNTVCSEACHAAYVAYCSGGWMR